MSKWNALRERTSACRSATFRILRQAPQAYTRSLAYAFVQFIGAVFIFLSQVVTARVLGPMEFGYFALTFALFNIGAALSTAGRDTAVLRFLPQYIAKRDFASLYAFTKLSERALLRLSALLSLLALLSAAAIAFAGGPEPLWTGMAAAALALPLQAFLLYFSAALRSVFRLTASQLGTQIALPLGMILVVGLLGGSVSWLATSAGVHVLLAGILIPIVLQSRRVFRASLPSNSTEPRWHDRHAWQSASRQFLFMTGVQISMARIGILCVGLLEGPVEAGKYSAALRVSVLLSLGLTAVNAWAAPTIAQYSALSQRDELRPVLVAASRALICISVPLSVLILVSGPYALSLFGESFRSAYSVLAVLVVGQLISAVTGPVGYVLTMTGHQVSASKLEAVWGGLALIATFAFVTQYGILGAAIAASASLIGRNMSMAIFVWRRLNLRVTPV